MYVSLPCPTIITKFSLFFPAVLPSATITPPSISVNEGELVRLVCEVTGSEPLNVSWTLSDGSPLPLGIQENGTELVIAAANRSHCGTYVCSVSNMAGTSQDEANVTVHRKSLIFIFSGLASSLIGRSCIKGLGEGVKISIVESLYNKARLRERKTSRLSHNVCNRI